MDSFDVCIVGAGVVGLAIAQQFAKAHPKLASQVVLLDQEASFGQHTSSRNSEVIHAGIYYAPGSLKARLCVRGKHLLYAHCEQQRVPYRRIGKYIVAQADQVDSLAQLASNAVANDVTDLLAIDQAQLQAAEPAITAHSALFSPSTGIIDSHAYMQSLLFAAQNAGIQFAPFTSVTAVEATGNGFTVQATIAARHQREHYRFRTATLINCAGLQAVALAARIGGPAPVPVPTMYLCKGDYFTYGARSPISHLVYPLPEKNTVGLGIHATLDLAGQLRFGPDTEYVDTIDYSVDPAKAVRFARAASRYFPAIKPELLTPAYAGIRPKLAPAGSPAQDFVICEHAALGMPGLVQLFGIESPGLTASLAIGEYVAEMIASHLG